MTSDEVTINDQAATIRALRLKVERLERALADPQKKVPGEQEVWIAFKADDENEPVMFFTELPGRELKSRFVLKKYLCRPTSN